VDYLGGLPTVQASEARERVALSILCRGHYLSRLLFRCHSRISVVIPSAARDPQFLPAYYAARRAFSRNVRNVIEYRKVSTAGILCWYCHLATPRITYSDRGSSICETILPSFL
jgi:hypothetical protein